MLKTKVEKFIGDVSNLSRWRFFFIKTHHRINFTWCELFVRHVWYANRWTGLTRDLLPNNDIRSSATKFPNGLIYIERINSHTIKCSAKIRYRKLISLYYTFNISYYSFDLIYISNENIISVSLISFIFVNLFVWNITI